MRKVKVGDKIRIITDTMTSFGHPSGTIRTVVEVYDGYPVIRCKCGRCPGYVILSKNEVFEITCTLEDVMQMAVLGEDVRSDIFLEALSKVDLT